MKEPADAGERATPPGRSGVLIYTAEMVSRAGSFLLAAAVARTASPEFFGLYSVAFAAATMASSIIDAGIANRIVLSSAPFRAIPRFILAKLAAAVPFAGVYWILLALSSEDNSTGRLAFYIAAHYVLLELGAVLEAFLRGRGHLNILAIGRALRSLIVLPSAVFILLTLLPFDLVGLVLVIAALIELLFYAIIAINCRGEATVYSPREVGGWWRSAAVTGSVGVYSRADTIIVSASLGVTSAGLYAAPYRIYDAACLLFNAIQKVNAPNQARSGPRYTGSLLRKFSAPSAAVFITLASAAPWIVPVLFGAAYSTSFVLVVLAAGIPGVMAGALLLNFALASQGTSRAAILATLITAIFNVLANLIAVPTLGLIGAASVNALSEWLMPTIVFLMLPDQDRRSVIAGFKEGGRSSKRKSVQ